MLYFANPSTQPVRDAMISGQLGAIVTPKQGNVVPAGSTWCADNGCFGDGYPGDEQWVTWLRRLPYDKVACRFAVAPDVVGSALATLNRSRPWLSNIREAGYPAAFVAQDNLELYEVPWDEFDVLFIGGSTHWKEGVHAAELSAEALARDKLVHMGRVNSLRRLRIAKKFGCTSTDGTYISFGPTKNLPRMLRFLKILEEG